MNSALIIVDVQDDFINGSLAVPDAAAIIPAIEELAEMPELVIATRDWHPADHMSFKAQGGMWPSHCVRGTQGAELHPVVFKVADYIVSKGTQKNIEEYSGFADASKEGRRLAHILRANDVTQVHIAGLATDYCVAATARDAIEHGYSVSIYQDAVRGVNDNGSAIALEELERQGAHIY